ncbi:MAG: ABC transporter ATP-binding protein [Phycisphaerae bacterium]|jgi:ABC-type multidrug transport system fused ATPase/permease subunit
MKAFNRIFKYILPQWPDVIVVVVSAILIAVLLSLSFMTVIPLLKVMMGEEGLHGWVDRKTCEWRYGLDFSVPERTDFLAEENNHDVGYYLLVTKVPKESSSGVSGLKIADRVIGAGQLLVTKDNPKIPFTELLRELASAKQDQITLQVKRVGPDNKVETVPVVLGKVWVKDSSEPVKFFRGVESSAKGKIIEAAQWALRFLPREQNQAGKTKAIIFIILAIGVVTVIRCLAKFYQGYIAEKVVQVAINHLREDAFGHAMDMPMGYFVNERSSDTVSRIVRDTTVMGAAIKIMLGKALREPLNAVFMLGFAMLLNWQLTLIFLCAAPFVLGLLDTFGRKMKKATRKSLEASSQMLGKLQETMAGLRVVKVYNQQQYEGGTFKNINNRLLKQLLKISKVDSATQPVLEVLGMAAGSAALIVGTYWVAQNKMDGSEFLGLLILLGATAEAVRKTSDIWNKIQEANAAAERVFKIIDEPIEHEKPDAVELKPMTLGIEFRNVMFSYPGTDKPILKGINLSVQAGHNIALVGPNGSGKTTLASLLPRFYDPDSGQILVDGQDIRDATLFSLRSQIGLVTQDVVTFNDTIAANIAYGKPGATREEIIAAAKRSFAHEFIIPLPDGYNTVIGEQGVGLSGGQLQRIVIARAILKNPTILIFDEATSQVDADSEAKIHQAIEEIMHGRTSFIIAHRFSTIINADVIVVMDDGRIVAKGRHEELMRTCPLYQSLYETQMITQ